MPQSAGFLLHNVFDDIWILELELSGIAMRSLSHCSTLSEVIAAFNITSLSRRRGSDTI